MIFIKINLPQENRLRFFIKIKKLKQGSLVHDGNEEKKGEDDGFKH